MKSQPDRPTHIDEKFVGNCTIMKPMLLTRMKDALKSVFRVRKGRHPSEPGRASEAKMERGARDWCDAQKYELDSAIQFMQGDFFQSVIEELNREDARVSKGYVEETMMTEFFGNDPSLWQSFLTHISEKSVLEIGPCVATSLSTWDVARKRYVIEPLYDDIVRYQMDRFGKTAFIGVDAYAQSAETLITELVDAVDGAILIRNCLDHSPQWPFIMTNIAQYAKQGAYLLLWNDLHHAPGYEEGHYDITKDVSAFRRLIEGLGFDIVLEYQDRISPNVNYGCLAIRS